MRSVMNVGGTLQNVGFALGGLLIMAAVFGLAMIFIVGATAASLWVMEWVPVVFWSNLLIAFFILGPLSLIPPTIYSCHWLCDRIVCFRRDDVVLWTRRYL